MRYNEKDKYIRHKTIYEIFKDNTREEVNNALKKLTKIELYIASMEESDVRLIFTKRYIQFKQWEDIAKEMCMSESSVFRRHREQLKKGVEK